MQLQGPQNQDVANVAWTFARLIVDDSACKVP